MKKQKTLIYVILIVFCIHQKSYAQQTAAPAVTADKKEEVKIAEPPEFSTKLEDLKALDYPELQVVPRASERLILEASATRDKPTILLAPFIASSFLTLTSGLVIGSSIKTDLDEKERTDTQTAAKFAVGTGVVGLGAIYWFIAADHYGTTLAQIRSFKNRDRRTELLKERLAEEAFEKSATLISQWKWAFSLINIAASAPLIGKSTGDNNVVPALSVAAALVPLFVTSSYEMNYNKVQEYKRKIYVPLTWFDYGYKPELATWQPQLNAIWTF